MNELPHNLHLTIEQQRKRIQELEEWQKIIIGTGTVQEAAIRMVAAEYTQVAMQVWEEKVEQQAQELEKLKADAFLAQEAYEMTLRREQEQSQEIARLQEALQLLYSVQNGCPLPSYKEEWTRAMVLTQAALKEQP